MSDPLELRPEPIDEAELAPATGEPQPLEGWRGADVDPDELVDDEWIAEHTTPLEAVVDDPARRTASGVGWTRDTVRRVAARTGLPVVEAWSGHNRGAMGTVVGPLLHHTATAAHVAGDYPTLRVVRDGRPGLENSLCMYGLGRSGTIYLINERLSWHAGAGEYGGITDGNGHLAGIEAESDGRAWTREQLDAYPRLVASILLETRRGAGWAPRHADYALPRGRKIDTSGFDINALRATVAHYLAHPEQINRGHTAPDREDDAMPPFVGFRNSEDGSMFIAAPGHWIPVPGPGYPELYQARGLVGEFRNIPPNEFGHFRDVFLSAPSGVAGMHPLLTDVQARQLPMVGAEVVALRAAVAALSESSSLSADELEAVVVQALRDNVVQVDVEVRGATAAPPDPDPAGLHS